MVVAERIGVESGEVELIAADKALMSLRSSGHDYCSAAGEVIDNSLQADANTIRVRVFTTKKKIGKNSKMTEVVERLAVGDDGEGMDRGVLHSALKLGYSSRYNDRKGMGRFGVGAKLGGISQARRIDLYSRQTINDDWLCTYIDLDEIEAGGMRHIPPPQEAELPDGCADLVGEKGTLVVWSKTDRLEENESGGGRRAETVRLDIVRYIARTFRKFLDRGIVIAVNDEPVLAHDPLFLMKSTRFHQGEPADPIAEVKVSEAIPFPVPSDPSRTSLVHVTLTLLPKELRRQRYKGGDDFAKERRIPESEGFSILRADREIFHGQLEGVQPPKKELDRFIGKEIRFEPDLDEYLHVRNVKKGAEPIEGVRDRLTQAVYKSVETLREEIKRHWDEVAAKTMQEEGKHTESERVVAETQRTTRKPKAGVNTPAEVVDQKVDAAAESLVKEVPEDIKPQKKKQLKERLKSQPYSVVPESWNGRELFVVEHLGLTTIVKLNMQHPFYTEVYGKLLAAEGQDQDANAKELAQTTRVGIDLLIAGYARAEGQFDDTNLEMFENFRTNWGLELRTLVNHWRKGQ